MRSLLILCILTLITLGAAVNSLVGAMLESALESPLEKKALEKLNATDVNGTHVAYSNSFPRVQFTASLENNTFFFNLTDKAGVVYKASLDDAFKKAAWFGGEEVEMIVNASADGVAVFLTTCDNEPLSLKPNVVDEHYYIPKRILMPHDSCVVVHLIATDGDSLGHVSFYPADHSKWVHLHILFGVTFGFILIILLLRQCSNHILRAIYSYDVMPEDLPSP